MRGASRRTVAARHRAVLGAVVTLLCVAWLGACGQQGSSGSLWKSSVLYKVRDRGVLRVATEPTFPPFESIEDGTIVGFDADLAKILADELGVELSFKRVKFESIIPTLTGGDVDLIISAMTATPERALKVSYSDPYFVTATNLLVSTKRAPGASGVKDLDQDGRIIAVKLGTTGDITATRIFKHAEIRRLKTQNLAALDVAQGNADAFLYDLSAVRAQHATHPDTTYVIETPVSAEPYAIACRKGDPETVAWLNLVIRTLRLDGRMRELYEKYGLEDGS